VGNEIQVDRREKKKQLAFPNIASTNAWFISKYKKCMQKNPEVNAQHKRKSLKSTMSTNCS